MDWQYISQYIQQARGVVSWAFCLFQSKVSSFFGRTGNTDVTQLISNNLMSENTQRIYPSTPPFRQVAAASPSEVRPMHRTLDELATAVERLDNCVSALVSRLAPILPQNQTIAGGTSNPGPAGGSEITMRLFTLTTRIEIISDIVRGTVNNVEI